MGFQNHFQMLNDLKIPRYVSVAQRVRLAYGACAYVRTVTEDDKRLHFYAQKQ